MATPEQHARYREIQGSLPRGEPLTALKCLGSFVKQNGVPALFTYTEQRDVTTHLMDAADRTGQNIGLSTVTLEPPPLKRDPERWDGKMEFDLTEDEPPDGQLF